jgi:hypothetical protein
MTLPSMVLIKGKLPGGPCMFFGGGAERGAFRRYVPEK